MNNLIIFKPTGEVSHPVEGDWIRDEYNEMSYINDEEVRHDNRHKFYPIYARYEIDATPEILRVLGMEAEG